MLREKKLDQQVTRITGAIGNLSIYDSDDDMDTSNMVDGSVILTDANGKEYMAFATRSLKKK